MRVWLYYAKTGGGHYAPAQAVVEELARRYGSKVQITWVDLSEGSWLLKFFFEGGYTFLMRRAEWLYALLYEMNTWRPLMLLEEILVTWIIQKKIIRSLQSEPPDVIVATHFLVRPLVVAVKKIGREIPIAVIVTDPYSAPPIWFYYSGLHYYVASEAVRRVAQQTGMPLRSITVVPQVVLTVSKKLVVLPSGLSSTQKTVLVVGGAEGLPNGEKVLRALLAASLVAQIVVVTGRDQKFFRTATEMAKNSLKKVVVYGYIDFLPALIGRADVVIIKAGANVMREVMQQQKPMIVSHYIWGQERGNMEYVVASGIGVYEPRPQKIPPLVEQYLYNATIIAEIAAAYRQIKHENGVEPTVDGIMKLVTVGVPNRN